MSRRTNVVTESLFQSCDLSHLHSAMERIHEQVALGHGRVELTRDGCGDVCVILSKAELESLERALEIFSQTSEYKSMCDALAKLAVDCGATGPANDLLTT